MTATEQARRRDRGPVIVYWGGQPPETTAAAVDARDCAAALAAAVAQHPDRDLVLIRADIQSPPRLLPRLLHALESAPSADAVTVCSNAHEYFNPFGVATDLDPPPAEADLDSLVAATAPNRLAPAPLWPEHLVLLRAGAAARLLAEDRDPTDLDPAHLGLEVLLSDRVFAWTETRDLWEQAPQQPWDLPPAQPGQARGDILQRLAAADCWSLPGLGRDDRPALLHVSHSWGGGVHRWVEDWATTDEDHHQLVLQSRGFWKRRQYGSELTLHYGAPDGPLIGEWHLVPPIASTAVEHSGYRQMLATIRQRYPLARVLVSSLIGHSLDALDTGLPTLQVMHDLYPAWPALEQPPPAAGADAIDPALMADSESKFTDRDRPAWRELRMAWLDHLRQPGVRAAAPSRGLVEHLHSLEPALKDLSIEVIPHGLRPLPQATAVDADDDGALRVVVPGHLHAGKGRELLLQALPELGPDVRIILLGCGKQGQPLLGRAGVDVIMAYQRAELPRLLGSLRPHLGALLSVVPESFSYTLSELRACGVPPLATRVGSFPERIEDGETGFLVDPEPGALAARLRGLAADRAPLKQVRATLVGHRPRGLDAMLTDYERVWPRPSTDAGRLPRAERMGLDGMELLHQRRLGHWQRRELQRREQLTHQLRQQVAERTAWARRTQGYLQRSERERRHTQRQFHASQERLQEREHEHAQQLDRIQAQRRRLERKLSGVESELEHTANLLDQVVNSRSWRLTRPMRVMSRVLRNARRLGAFNPARWPFLAGRVVMRYHQLGLRGTLHAMQVDPQLTGQAEGKPDAEPPAPRDSSQQPTTSIIWQDSDAPELTVLLYAAGEPAALGDTLTRLQTAQTQTPLALHVLAYDYDTETRALLERCEGLDVDFAADDAAMIARASARIDDAGDTDWLWLDNRARLSNDWLSSLRRLPATRTPPAVIAAQLADSAGYASDGARRLLADDPRIAHARPTPEQPVGAVLFRTAGRPALQAALSGASDLDDLWARVSRRLRDDGASCWVQGQARLQWRDAETAPPVLHGPSQTERPRILVVDAWIPMPDKDSGSLRMVNLLKIMRELNWQPVLVPAHAEEEGGYAKRLGERGIEVWSRQQCPNVADFLRDQGRNFRAVILSRHTVAHELVRPVRRYCPRALLVFDTVDLHHLREKRLAELRASATLQQVAEQTRRRELAVMRESDLTLVVSPAEQAYLRETVPQTRVRILSNIHEIPGSPNGFEQRAGMIFVGGFQHPPNVDAARWLVTEIWPLIHAELPDARLSIIGSKITDEIRKLSGPGVDILGFVPDLEPHLHGARLALAPLRYGAGIKGKVNSSMSHGQPVIATSAAVEGTGLHHEHDVMIADTAREFAAAAVRAYTDAELWQRLAVNGLDNVRRHFSFDVARECIADILEQASQRFEGSTEGADTISR